jgi:hypothetical protein
VRYSVAPRGLNDFFYASNFLTAVEIDFPSAFNGVFEPTLSKEKRCKFDLGDFAIATREPNIGSPHSLLKA